MIQGSWLDTTDDDGFSPEILALIRKHASGAGFGLLANAAIFPHFDKRGTAAAINESAADPDQLAIGTRVQIAFALDEPEPIMVQGEVRWRRAAKRPGTDAGVGVQFVDVTDTSRTRIEQFVRRHKLQGFVPLAQERLALARLMSS